MKFYHGMLTLCIIGGCTHSSTSFVVQPSPSSSLSNTYNTKCSRTERCMTTTAGDETASAKAFTDYMAKSHVEKLKALKDLEDKKNAEIQTLKEEMQQMKSSGGGGLVQTQAPPPQQPPAPIVQGSIEDLSAKLLAYQKFMAEYIVKAQEDKNRAVKEAQAAITKKYEDKLNAFMLPGGESAAVTPAAVSAGGGAESKLYQGRNENIAAAAKAGKSRWGNKELQKVAGVSVELSSTSTDIPAVSSAPVVTEETIAAADHGLRADGGVGGLTLAERLSDGAAANTNGVVIASSLTSATVSPLYALRNAKVSEAAKAGKQSRWGDMEVKKATEISSNALPSAAAASNANGKEIVVTPEIDAADHGLRADGGVGGPSLAERVNLGAQLLQ